MDLGRIGVTWCSLATKARASFTWLHESPNVLARGERRSTRVLLVKASKPFNVATNASDVHSNALLPPSIFRHDLLQRGQGSLHRREASTSEREHTKQTSWIRHERAGMGWLPVWPELAYDAVQAGQRARQEGMAVTKQTSEQRHATVCNTKKDDSVTAEDWMWSVSRRYCQDEANGAGQSLKDGVIFAVGWVRCGLEKQDVCDRWQLVFPLLVAFAFRGSQGCRPDSRPGAGSPPFTPGQVPGALPRNKTRT